MMKPTAAVALLACLAASMAFAQLDLGGRAQQPADKWAKALLIDATKACYASYRPM